MKLPWQSFWPVWLGPWLVLALSMSQLENRQAPATDLLVLTNITVVDVQRGTLSPDQTVIVERDHIYSVEPSQFAKYPRSARSVDGRGLFLIPAILPSRSSWPMASPVCVTWAANLM